MCSLKLYFRLSLSRKADVDNAVLFPRELTFVGD